MKLITLALVLLLVVTLSGCALLAGSSPASLSQVAEGQHRIDFSNPLDEPASFAVTIEATTLEGITTTDGLPYPSCANYEVEGNDFTEWACDFGELGPGESAPPVVVHGTGVSCNVTRYPVFRLYPCRVNSSPNL